MREQTGLSLRARVAAVAAAALALTGVGAATLAPPAQADGPTTFGSSTPITIVSPTDPGTVAPATPYPSQVEVAGMSGLVSDVSVELVGVSHLFVNDVDVLLLAPNGTSMVVMSDVGEETFALSASGSDITIADGGAAFPTEGVLPTGTYAPRDTDPGADTFPGAGGTPSSSTSLGDAFGGIDPNGTWSLYVVDDTTGDDGLIAGGWSLTVTTAEDTVATQITASVSPNPALTGSPITLTALVTADGIPVTEGTVSFDNVGLVGYPGQPLDEDGRATLVLDPWPSEGRNEWVATYEPAAGYAPSSTSFQLVADDPTEVSGNLYCNPGATVLPDVGTPPAYPLQVFVDGAPGTVAEVAVRLPGLSHSSTADLDVMLRSPSGDTLMLMSDVPGNLATATAVAFADSGAELVELTGPGTYLPTDLDNVHDTFPAPAPEPSDATTFAEAFGGTEPNGAWSLFVVDNATGDGGALQNGDWCLELTTTSPSDIVLDAPATVAAGDDVAVTATVTSDSEPVGVGTVSYSLDGATPVDAGTPDSDGEVTFTLADLPRGSHVVEATYTGADSFADSTAEPVTVLAQSETSLTASADPTIMLGQDAVVSATVSAPDGPVDAGSLSYSVDGGSTVPAGTPDSDGEVEIRIADLPRGSHSILVFYTGADGWTDSVAAPLTVLVQQETETQAVAPDRVAEREDVDVVVTVSPLAGTETVAAGSVGYTVDGGDPISAGDVDADGEVAFSIAGLAPGVHEVAIAYGGSGDGWMPSGTSFSVVVLATTGIVLDAPTEITESDDLEVTATVTAGGDPVDDGSVSYSVDGGPALPAGTPGVDGTVTFTVTGLAGGNHTIEATYTGVDPWADSSAEPVDVLVNRLTTSTLSAPATATDGEDVVLTSEVTATGATPTGSVTFSDGDDSLGTVALVDGTATLTTPLPAGARTITATYNPDPGFLSSDDATGIDVLPVVTAGGPYAISEGDGLTLSAAGSSAAANLSWDLDGDGDFSDATGLEPMLTWAELEAFGIDDGPVAYPVAARAEVDGLTATAEAAIEVSNTGPEAIVDGPRTAVVGEELTLKVSADDPSSADMAELFTYRVDWGDGSPVLEVVGPADPPVSHTYATAGSYEATFWVVDRDGSRGGDLVIAVAVSPAPTEPTTETPVEPTDPPSGDPAPTTGPGTGGSGTAPPSGGGADEMPATGMAGAQTAAALAALLLAAGALLLARRRRTLER
ncbi:Ig-like domain repeat protein [Pseudactinotalea terrae]|uniref:Ig-like domain repeat protein n=1 Tax=Pseudactinotalea terrae TaxID=1743262 RepID=UPI0012E1F300|nr:Ig-like domain repeat protein [Pseudactinotalea terrae]